MHFQLDRQALAIEYAIHPDDDATYSSVHNLNEAREHRRLARPLEYHLPACEVWGVEISTRRLQTRFRSYHGQCGA